MERRQSKIHDETYTTQAANSVLREVKGKVRKQKGKCKTRVKVVLRTSKKRRRITRKSYSVTSLGGVEEAVGAVVVVRVVVHIILAVVDGVFVVTVGVGGAVRYRHGPVIAAGFAFGAVMVEVRSGRSTGRGRGGLLGALGFLVVFL